MVRTIKCRNIYTFDHVTKKHNLTTAHEAYGEIPKKLTQIYYNNNIPSGVNRFVLRKDEARM
jgi:hypothetical protein